MIRKALADRVRHGTRDFAAHIRGLRSDEPLPFYDATLPAAVIGSLLLGELLVHGWDLAHLPIPPHAAAMAGPAALHVLPLVVRRGGPARGERAAAVVVVVEQGGSRSRWSAEAES